MNGKCMLHQTIHEKVEEHHAALFDKKFGLAYCVKDKVSKKALALWVIAIMGVSATFIVAGLNSWGNAKDERKDNKSAISVVETKFNAIEKSIEEIKEKQIDPKELLRQIKNIINEKKKE